MPTGTNTSSFFSITEFLFDYLEGIDLWLGYELGQTHVLPSVQKMRDVLSTTAAKELVRGQLRDLLAIMKPVAKYIESFSDESPYKALVVSKMTTELTVALLELPRDLHNAFHASLLEELKDYRHESRNDNLWRVCSWFAPSLAIREIKGNRKITHHHVNVALGVCDAIISMHAIILFIFTKESRFSTYKRFPPPPPG